MKRKYGFTLIELLAVIVVLGIIALIATPIVLNLIESSRKGAAEQSTISYVKAIENEVVRALLDNIKYEEKEDYVYDEIKVEVSGTYPTGGLYSLEQGTVTNGVFCVNGYEVEYSENKAEAKGKCTGEDLKLNGSVKLSETSGYYTYPEIGTFEVVENLSGGALTCTTSDEEVATCEVSGNEVTVTPGTKEGVAKLTITSESTSKYKEAQAAHVATTEPGPLSVTVNPYSGTYDGEGHGITVTSSGATIRYGAGVTENSDGTKTLIESSEINPTYTDAGIYTVYYQVEKPGYQTVTGSATVTINKAEGSATLSSTSGTVSSGATTTFTVSNATGTLSCSTSNSSVSDCSITGTTVTITGVKEGTATITINVAEATNYTATSKTYSVIVKTPTLSDLVSVGDYINMTPTSTSYTVPASLTGYTSDKTINPSELNVWRVIKINDDGTIEMVSENVSSTNVYFRGQTGYKNLVGTLNTIAKQYENSNYTIGSRHMGYNSQTEYLTDTAKTVDSTSTTAPWTCSTGGSCNPVESQGGGDKLYTTDTNLVKSALGTLKAYDPSGTEIAYWLAARNYNYSSSSTWYYFGRRVYAGGSITINYLYYYNSGFLTSSSSGAVRPIVTLKSGLTATGSGTSDDPWVLG